MLQDYIFRTLVDLIQLLILVLGGMAVVYLRRHFSLQQLDKAREITYIAVNAVEMIARACNFDSKQKFEKAMAFVKEFAAKHGLKLTDEQWQVLIEAAVHRLKVVEEELTKPDSDNTSQESEEVV